MTIKVCRLMRDFPSLEGIERIPASDALETEINYVEYGLAPGVYNLMREQVSLGSQMYVIAVKSGDVANHESADGINVYRVNRPYNLTALMKMKELDDTIGIDIVHAHATSAIGYAFSRGLLKRKPYVVHVHGTTAGIINSIRTPPFTAPKRTVKQKFWAWVSLRRQKLMWKRADLLIAVSNNVAEELNKFYSIPPKKIRVVQNGVDVDFFKPADKKARQSARERLRIRRPVILYVGHLSPTKGLEYLLKATTRVTKKFPEAVFIILGGTPKYIKRTDYHQIWSKLTIELGISRNVLFAGEVRHKDTLNFYAAADAFVFPTLYEGMAKALLEAMACGLPVIATKVGGNPDAIIHDETGILIEPRNAEQLADALIRVLSDSSLARSIGSKARGRVEKLFTWRIAANKIMTVYQELLGQTAN